MGLDKLYGISKKFGDIMKDPEIKVLVYNVQQSLENLNNQLLNLAQYGVNVQFTWERDPQTEAIRILLSTCSQSVDYLKE
jgi:hypothetical protein